MIKNIIFDIGNVLLQFNPLDYLKKIFNDDIIEKLIYKEVFKSEEWISLDRGILTEDQAVKVISQRNPVHKAHIEICMDNWIDILTPIEGTVKIVSILKENGYNLYLLSNFHSLAFETIYSKYDFFNLFDGGVISCKENVLKPEAEIYTKLLDDYNLAPEECLFIDDTLINVEAANKLGINTIQFSNCEALKEGLNKFI
jgi:epoxide hydrolase-like predicted phosphatase